VIVVRAGLPGDEADDSSVAGIEVRPLSLGEEPFWDKFIARHEDATFFHQRAWARAVEEGIGHKAYPLAAWRDGRLSGILPLTHVKSRLFGDALISAGFAVAGGVLAEDKMAARALAQAAAALARDLHVERIELRHERPTSLPRYWVVNSGPYASFRRDITPSDDANLKAIPRKKRADLRKALSDRRLCVETGFELGAFYAMYARSVRDLGTPVYPRGFFEAIRSCFGDAAEISAVIGPDGPAATVMTFWFKNRVMPYFGGAIPKARQLHAYDLLYWEVMRRAAARGSRVYDFGRSKKGTGAYDYKIFWGFNPEPLGYQHLLLRGEKVPEVNPLNPKYRLMIAAWKHMPIAIANALGPLVARQLG
jgi:FemAB-related protein (PEP-CTERM system-associated)